MPRLLFALLLCFAPLVCTANALLDAPDLRLSLGQFASYYEDTDGGLTFEQARALPAAAFHPVARTHANFGKSRSAWWLRVTLDNRQAQALDGYIQVEYPHLDSLQLYLIDAQGTVSRQVGGDVGPFSARPVKVNNFWFPARIEPGSTALYLRVQSTSALLVPLFFSTYNASAEAEQSSLILDGAYYGVLFGMFCYNLFLYLSLREKAYFWYLAYSLNVGLLSACLDGILIKLIPDIHLPQSYLLYSLMFLHCLAALQFSRHFLQTPQHFPRMDRVLRVSLAVVGLFLLAAPFFALFAQNILLWNMLSSLTMLVVSLLLLLNGIYVWRKGMRFGRYYTLAWGALLVTLILSMLSTLGLEVISLYGGALIKIGITIELITLSIGLADRINRLQEEGFRSRQDAEQAHIESRAKGRFLAKMSHEIRTPLNGVLGMLQLLGDTPLNRTQRFYLDTISSSGGSLMTVINDILDYARMEAGKLQLEHIEFDLEQLISETLSLFTGKALEKQLQLHVSLALGVPRYVQGDPTRLKQILMNLLSNALKFTSEGHVTLSVCRQQVNGEPSLRFSVADSGIGIDEQGLKQLFESFAQADSSTTRRYGGTGLGLAISKELIELMGGEVQVHSTPGQGTRFTFNVPLGTEPGHDEADELSQLLSGQAVLLASADSVGLVAMSHLLERWQMRVSHCQAVADLNRCLDSHASAPLLIIKAPWPGQVAGWLDAVRHRQVPPRVLLLCPAEQCHQQPSPAGWQVQAVALPLVITTLREALLQLYEQRQALPAAELPPLQAPRADGPCILVAEDNPVNQLVAQGILGKRGYRVRLVDNGLAAVAEYQRDPLTIQLILMDCEMPTMDGFEATRQIRDLERRSDWPRVPIVALSAHMLDEHRQRGIECGMNAFLGKPLEIKLLYATLERFLGGEASS